MTDDETLKKDSSRYKINEMSCSHIMKSTVDYTYLHTKYSGRSKTRTVNERADLPTVTDLQNAAGLRP